MSVLMHKQALKGAAGPPAEPRSKPIASRGSRNIVVRAQAQQGKTEAGLGTDRRSVLALGAGGLLASGLVQGPAVATELKYLEVDQLSTFQRSDQQNAFRAKVESILKENLDPADSPVYVRLALHDAGTYDSVTKTGGFDGSIILNAEELSRPENKGLDAAIQKLKDVKAKIDEQVVSPISWADLIYLAGKISTQKQWFVEKVMMLL
ncbi:heme peroxidase [Dunaliella salina]|uniref:Heme peroxidase n=1 Tax=Dunaliella salina TaxID=3046 RepID=A0ABQ7G3W7_DUNSA|nr:heme peroxidase [Dunaliella salina]|eukprot:KAF5829308.1 heme peroxidase [Dunaliella salina]